DLSEAIKWLNISYVTWFNRKTGRNGPLLQGRLKGVVHDPSEAGWLHTKSVLNWIPVRTPNGKRNQYRERFREKIGARDLGTVSKERLAGDLILGENDFVEKVVEDYRVASQE